MRYARRGSALFLSTAVGICVAVFPAAAQTPLPLGAQAPANSVTAGNQDQPAVAMDANGDFVVVWRDEFLDGSGTAIVGRRFSSATGLPLSPQVVLNTTTAGDQAHPAIAMNANGRFVVVWEGPDSTGPATTGIFGTLRAADGTPIVAEFQVNTTTLGIQRAPAVAMQADGRFLVTWEDDSGVGFGAAFFDIGGRFYPSTFPTDPPAAPIRLNTGILGGDQTHPAVGTVPSTGGWYVAWHGPTLPPVAPATWLRALDNSGNGGNEVQLNTSSSTSLLSQVRLATNGFGDGVAVWYDPLANSVVARRISAGAPIGVAEAINISPDHINREPAIALDKFGNFLAIWVEAVGALGGKSPEGSPIVIQGRKKSSGGGFESPLIPPLDAQFQVNSHGSNFAAPVIAGRPHGNFVAIWQGTEPGDSSGLGISLRRFLDACFVDDFETADTLRWSNTVP